MLLILLYSVHQKAVSHTCFWEHTLQSKISKVQPNSPFWTIIVQWQTVVLMAELQGTWYEFDFVHYRGLWLCGIQVPCLFENLLFQWLLKWKGKGPVNFSDYQGSILFIVFCQFNLSSVSSENFLCPVSKWQLKLILNQLIKKAVKSF